MLWDTHAPSYRPEWNNNADQTYSCPETAVFRHHGDPTEVPLETPRTSQHYHLTYAPLYRETLVSRTARANLTRITSPSNTNTGGSRLIFSVPFSHFSFIFYLPRCTLQDFPSVSSLASLPFLPCCHRTTTPDSIYEVFQSCAYRLNVDAQFNGFELIGFAAPYITALSY